LVPLPNRAYAHQSNVAALQALQHQQQMAIQQQQEYLRQRALTQQQGLAAMTASQANDYNDLVRANIEYHANAQLRLFAAQPQDARSRAKELLMSHLTPEQQRTFKDNGWFIVEGGKSKTKYRIRCDHSTANIYALKGDQTTHRLCAHCLPHIPLADHLLAQKVMLEMAEETFLRLANRHAA